MAVNQHEWVRDCQARYEEQGLELGNPDDGEWQEAHYPAPKGVGTDVIWLRSEDHQVQGLYQSEEYGRPCFFNADVKTFLDNNWCSNWFELYALYEKWAGYNGKANGRDQMTPGKAREYGKANAAALNDHENTRKSRSDNGKSTTTQRWQCLVTGHVSSPGSLSVYQRARGIDVALRERLE